MKLTIGNVYTKVVECNDTELAFLLTCLEVTVPGYQHTNAFKNGLWDGKKSFFSQAYRTFLSGFLPFLLEQAAQANIKIAATDQRNPLSMRDPVSFAQRYPKARPYQVDALQKLFTSTLRFANCVIPWARGVAKIPTAGGKTFTAGCLIDFIGKRTLFVVERKNLAHQSAKELQKLTKMSVGILGDGHADYQDITVGIIQTIRHKLKDKAFVRWLNTVDVLVIDECHHVNKGTYHDLLVKCPAYYRYGLSATPSMRNDLGDIYLVADIGATIVDTPRKDLEDAGFLAKPKVVLFSVREPNGLTYDWRRAYQELIVENHVRNTMIVTAVKKLRSRGCKVLILVSILDHGNTLRQLLKQQKIKSTYIHGKNSSEEREAALKALETGSDVLIASRIFDEGMNAPVINALVLAGAGQSSIQTIQRVGRAVRPKPDDNTCYVLDFVDKNNKYLLRHSAQRVSIYEQEGFSLTYPKHV